MKSGILKQYLDTDSPRWTSIFYGQEKRYLEARRQCDKKKVKPENIIDYVLEFFSKCEIKTIEYSQDNKYSIFRPIKEDTDLNVFNKNIRNKYNTNKNEDIIWMKFTQDGHLGVVATSNDINFELAQQPLDSESIPDLQKGNWKYSASATLIRYVGKQWEKSRTLVFPLLNINNPIERHRIETAVGNYLSKEKEVPIIDFYSHRINTKLRKGEL